MRSHDPTELLRNLIQLEFHFVGAVDADHGGHVCYPDMIVATHDVSDRACLDAVVHRDSALMRNRILECDVFHRFEDVVVLLQHVCLLKGLVKGRWVGLRCEISWNLQAKLCSDTLMRFFACPKASPNVATLTRGCDQIGC